MIALCFQTGGTGLSVQDGKQQRMVPGDFLMVGPTSPNEFQVASPSCSAGTAIGL